jgi:hypothetical protein
MPMVLSWRCLLICCKVAVTTMLLRQHRSPLIRIPLRFHLGKSSSLRQATMLNSQVGLCRIPSQLWILFLPSSIFITRNCTYSFQDWRDCNFISFYQVWSFASCLIIFIEFWWLGNRSISLFGLSRLDSLVLLYGTHNFKPWTEFVGHLNYYFNYLFFQITKVWIISCLTVALTV